MKMCTLETNKICDHCGKCDDRCILDSSKTCDNCFKCLEPEKEYAEIPISEILMETDESAFNESSEAAFFNAVKGTKFFQYRAVCPRLIKGKRLI